MKLTKLKTHFYMECNQNINWKILILPYPKEYFYNAKQRQIVKKLFWGATFENNVE